MLKRFSPKATYALKHEINVTPFVDVMLVLLIIFMVATPMMQSGISVDLPSGQSSENTPQTQPLTLSLDKSGELFLREQKVNLPNLIGILKKLPPETTKNIYIKADKTLSYDKVVSLMSLLASQGFSKIVLVIEKTF